MSLRDTIVALVGTFLLLSPGPARAVDVTACGQIVPPGEIGVLTGDLDCTIDGVVLESGATLSLSGHELRGGTNIGVYCRRGRCGIEGPGAIADGDWIAVFLEDGVKLTLRNVVFRANDVGVLGSYAGRNKVTASDVVFQDQRQWAMTARSLRGTNVTMTGNASESLFTMSVGTVRITGGNVSDNFEVGVKGSSVSLDGVTVTNNAGPGVVASRRMRLVESTVTGNDPAGAGIDLLSERRPKLVASTCGKSANAEGVPWGVCTAD